MATAKSSFCYPSLNISSSDVGETEKRVTFNDSPTPSINGVLLKLSLRQTNLSN